MYGSNIYVEVNILLYRIVLTEMVIYDAWERDTAARTIRPPSFG